MKKFLAGISVSVISTLLSFSAFADGHKVLTVASWAAPFHTQNENVFPWMNDELSSCSGGTLGLKVEYGLAPPPALYDSIRDGVADMTWIVYGYTPGKFVTTMIAELPLIPGNAQEKSVAFQKTYEKYLEAAGEAKGVQILANFTHGPGMANTTKKITSYKELEGVKMRVGGGVANAIGTALGIAGVNAPAPKVYEIISGGVADGVMFPFETMHAFKIAELAKYSLSNPDGMYTTAFAVIMNDDTYNDLSASHKKCIDDMRGVSLSRKIGNYWDQADEVGKASAAEYNHELTIANNDERQYFKAKMGPVIDDVLAKINAVGVVGLVENMPDGNAQRPGDIVKSYSGKTVEILNTDAEGRLVLADALTYTEEKYKPKFIVDLATLTGAIIVSLGSEYAGLFSNDDKLSNQLIDVGEKTEEKVWRMPLNKNFDKLIDSKNADMQNINYVGGAGSTTAAQFLQRFILNKTPWAHLDIAGMAFSKYGGALNSGGATGYGVRLLNKLVEDYYE